MRFEAGVNGAESGCALDFSRRAELSERMDEPGSYEEFRDCLRSLEVSNRLTFNARPTLAWVAKFGDVARPLHLVDVGCGGGDMPRAPPVRLRRRRAVFAGSPAMPSFTSRTDPST